MFRKSRTGGTLIFDPKDNGLKRAPINFISENVCALKTVTENINQLALAKTSKHSCKQRWPCNMSRIEC